MANNKLGSNFEQYFRLATQIASKMSHSLVDGYIDLVTVDPDSEHKFNRKKGNNCYNNGEYSEAIPFLKSALEVNANDVDVLYHLGVCLAKVHRDDEAIEFL